MDVHGLFLSVLSAMILYMRCQSVRGTMIPEVEFKYHSNKELETLLQNFTISFPTLTSLSSIGRTLGNHELWVLRVSNAPEDQLAVPNVKIIANIHGNEAFGRELVLQLIKHLLINHNNTDIKWLLDNTRIYLMPTLNPDGFDMASVNCISGGGRGNKRGVDLNRNFPDAFKKNTMPRQLETQAIIDWLKKVPFILSASLHGGALVVNYPYDNNPEDTWDAAFKLLNKTGNDGNMETIWKMLPHGPGIHPRESLTPDDDVFRYIAKDYANSHPIMHQGVPCRPSAREIFEGGITNGAAWYPLIGGMQDYNYIQHGCFELTLELSCCKYPKAENLSNIWEENKKPLLQFIRQAHRGIKGVVYDSETKIPIGGATIVLMGRNANFTTTMRGEFWRILLPGIYKLQIIAKEYATHIKEVLVPREEGGDRPGLLFLNISLINMTNRVTKPPLYFNLHTKNIADVPPFNPASPIVDNTMAQSSKPSEKVDAELNNAIKLIDTSGACKGIMPMGVLSTSVLFVIISIYIYKI